MLEELVKDIEALLPSHRPVVVGVSGGADSVTLLHLLARTRLPLVVAHVNFGLRGEESNRDEAFVQQEVAHRYPSVEVRVLRCDAAAYAREEGVSVEMAARQLRYRFFDELRAEVGAEAIAVGHNADDQVETLLLNLARGTGGKGLVGMQYYERGVLRPLLSLSRQEIMEYVAHYQLPFVEDSTNSQLLFKRNVVRHQIIPLLEQLNPAFRSTVLQSMAVFRAEQEVVDSAVAKFAKERLNARTRTLSLYHLPHNAQLLLYRLVQPLGFTSGQVADILADTQRSGKLFRSAVTQEVLELFRQRLYLVQEPAPLGNQQVQMGQSLPLGELGVCTLDHKLGGLCMAQEALPPTPSYVLPRGKITLPPLVWHVGVSGSSIT